MTKTLYRFSGLLAIGAIAAALVMSYAQFPSGQLPVALSEMGTSDAGRAWFTSGLATAAMLMTPFFRGFIEPVYRPGKMFRFFYLAAALLLLIVALTPSNPSQTVLYATHWTAALTLGVVIVGAMIRFARMRADNVPWDIRSYVIGAACTAAIAASIVAVFFLESFALAQLSAIVITCYWITRVTFLPVPAQELGTTREQL